MGHGIVQQPLPESFQENVYTVNCSEILSAVFLLSTYSGRMHIEIQDCTTALRRRAGAATSQRGGQDRCGRQGG